ncbi:hypothetical protein NM74_09705 [Aeromonas hydrophila]|uniref:hypothetical protein n=1 Tax=Aeromonas hydrophila TaxID=644 RepID=UPI0005368808|nr:hypothetical protein [Aeromonas hydrophila]KHA56812.1 hypothetical protein NM74_09705 [Aeromonas hydrophila]
MAEFKLTLHVDQDDLRIMHDAGQKIVIRKSSSSGEPNVAWIAFKPMASNTVKWTTNYGFYASTTEIRSGAKIDRMSQLPTRSNPSVYPAASELYKLNDAAIFENNAGSLEPGEYGFINSFNSEKYLTCGLLLAANVNGKIVLEPQSAILVPKGNKMKAKPFEILEVFIASEVDSGSVLTQVTSNIYKATYEGKINHISCEYNADKAAFVQVENLSENDVTKYLVYASLFFGTAAMATWAYNNKDLIVQGAKLISAQFKDLNTATKTFKIIAASASACADAAKAIETAIQTQYPGPQLEFTLGGDADWVKAEVTACQRDPIHSQIGHQRKVATV